MIDRPVRPADADADARERDPLRWRAVRCTDADDQAAALPGWRQRYEQLSPGGFVGELQYAALPNGYAFFTEANNRRLAETVAPPSDTMVFALRHDDGPPARLDQASFGRDDLACLNGGADALVTVPDGTRLAAVVVPLAELSRYEGVMPGGSTRSLGARTRVARSTMTPMLRGFFEQVMAVSRDDPAALAAPQAQRALCGATVSNLMYAIGGDAGPAEPGTERRRWQTVQHARALIHDRARQVFTVADVCATIGVSRRTLQYCFEDVLQTNPIAYIRAVRLNAARRDLKQAGGTRDTVADVAARHGFWHLGHFAVDYKRMFGESPSATLHGASPARRHDRRHGATMGE